MHQIGRDLVGHPNEIVEGGHSAGTSWAIRRERSPSAS